MFPQMRQTLTHHQHLTTNNQQPTTITQPPFNQHIPSDAPNFNTSSTPNIQHPTPNSALNSSQGYHS